MDQYRSVPISRYEDLHIHTIRNGRQGLEGTETLSDDDCLFHTFISPKVSQSSKLGEYSFKVLHINCHTWRGNILLINYYTVWCAGTLGELRVPLLVRAVAAIQHKYTERIIYNYYSYFYNFQILNLLFMCYLCDVQNGLNINKSFYMTWSR